MVSPAKRGRRRPSGSSGAEGWACSGATTASGPAASPISTPSGSVAGLFGSAGQSGYSTGKAGIVGLTRTLAKEWGRYKVNVNVVAFGFIHTRLTAPIGSNNDTIEIQGRAVKVGIQPKYIETLEQLIPIGRAGTADEAAGAVYLLCTPESNYISGQVVACSGGLAV